MLRVTNACHIVVCAILPDYYNTDKLILPEAEDTLGVFFFTSLMSSLDVLLWNSKYKYKFVEIVITLHTGYSLQHVYPSRVSPRTQVEFMISDTNDRANNHDINGENGAANCGARLFVKNPPSLISPWRFAK